MLTNLHLNQDGVVSCQDPIFGMEPRNRTVSGLVCEMSRGLTAIINLTAASRDPFRVQKQWSWTETTRPFVNPVAGFSTDPEGVPSSCEVVHTGAPHLRFIRG